jgi:CubicO group peptidase (beta-lactamase class C family)
MQFEQRPTSPEERMAQRRRTTRKPINRRTRHMRSSTRSAGYGGYADDRRYAHGRAHFAHLRRMVVIISVLVIAAFYGTRMLFAPEAPSYSSFPGAPADSGNPDVGASAGATAMPVLPTVTPATLPAADSVPLSGALPEQGTGGQPGLPSAPRRNADQALRSALHTYMTDLEAKNQFSGAVLVARGGSILLNRGYGMANWERNTPNTPQTRFRLASLTKSFTAMGIMMLQAEGQLHVQDPICTYLPDCPEAWKPVTIHHLLAHTSGIPNYTSFVDFEETEMLRTTTAQLVARFRDEPLLAPPGQVHSYSNSGYVLLGLIIEQVSGQSYEAFMQEHIFTPLQMEDTGYDHNTGSITEQAHAYTQAGVEAPFLDVSTLYASGALYSTVEDLYRWDQALYTEYFVPQALLNQMFTPVQGGYGYGWWVTSAFGRRAISHTGYMTGFSNYIVRFPDERVCVIVLSNLQTSQSEIIGDRLAEMVFQAQAQ